LGLLEKCFAERHGKLLEMFIFLNDFQAIRIEAGRLGSYTSLPL
jgi:hypothetical protein